MHPYLRVLIRSLLVLLLLGLAVLVPRPARAETLNCTAITAVPFTISAPGIYCLTQDIATNLASGNAIEIQANNVVLDLNGHRLGNLAAGRGTTAYGIYALSRQNITIKNGTIRGFQIAIALEDSQGHVVKDLRADQNTDMGIFIDGRANIIRNTQVVATGGSPLRSDAYGIVVQGSENRVLDNDVIDTFGTGTGAIGTGIQFFTNTLTTDVLAVNNRITHADYGISFASNSTGKYRDTLTRGVTTPYTGGTDAGNNH